MSAATPPDIDEIQTFASRQGCQPRPPTPSTHTNLLYHLIFATKDRRPLILPAWRQRLHEYLGGVVGGLGGTPLGVGGVADHVHLLAGLKPTHRLSDFTRELKKASSIWAAAASELPFQWQEGYAAFTVSTSASEEVRQYIARQEEHHRTRTFRQELEEFLRKNNVACDERFLD